MLSSATTVSLLSCKGIPLFAAYWYSPATTHIEQLSYPEFSQVGFGVTVGRFTWEPDPVTLIAGAGGMICTPHGRALQCERRVKGWDWLREDTGR
jgi:hypothetical protein